MPTVRRTGIVVAAAALVLTGACVYGDGESSSASSDTTEPDDPSTTTTEPGGSGDDGESAAGDECDGPIWALKAAQATDAADEDDPVDTGSDDASDSDDPESGSTTETTDSDSSGTDDESDESDDSETEVPELPDDEREPDGGGSGGATGECEPTPGQGTEPELGTGDVQITLRWESDSDLDLHVVEPSGEEIWYSDPGPTETGGQLDVDSNVGCDNDGSVENVFWPEGDMPLGEYEVQVVGFSVDGCGGGDYTLTATVQGEDVLDETGSVGEDEEDSYSFEAQ
jgi:hypothetical protein